MASLEATEQEQTVMEATNDSGQSYILYYNQYSLCSSMVRLTLAFARSTDNHLPVIQERPVDLQNGGQLEEYYLCGVNPKGTVPVLAHSTELSKTLTESLDITYYVRPYCAALWPADKATQIEPLLKELHELSYFSLTYARRPQRAVDMENAVLERLQEQQITPRYRDALKYKLEVVRTTRAPVLVPEVVTRAEEQAAEFLNKLSASLVDRRDADGPWLLGTQSPTALDAHVIPFLARLVDVDRANMLDEKVTAYATMALKSSEWQTIAQGRKTVAQAYQ